MYCFLKSQSLVLPLSNTFEVCSTFNLIYLNVCYIPKCLSLSSISQQYDILCYILFLRMLSLVAMFCPTLRGEKWFSCYNLITS